MQTIEESSTPTSERARRVTGSPDELPVIELDFSSCDDDVPEPPANLPRASSGLDAAIPAELRSPALRAATTHDPIRPGTTQNPVRAATTQNPIRAATTKAPSRLATTQNPIRSVATTAPLRGATQPPLRVTATQPPTRPPLRAASTQSPGRPPTQSPTQAPEDVAGPIRTLVFAPEANRARWIESELSHAATAILEPHEPRPQITIQLGRRVRTVVSALVRDPPPRPQVLIVDFDAVSPAELFELHAIREEGWTGRLIGLGDVPDALRTSLAIDRVFTAPFVRDSLLDCVAGTRHAAVTLIIPVIPTEPRS